MSVDVTEAPLRNGVHLKILFCIAVWFIVLHGSVSYAQVKNLTEGKRAVLNNALFKPGLTEVEPDKMILLDSIGVLLQSTNELSIQVDGYADNQGSNSINVKISQERANKVRDYLVKKFHIDPVRIIAKGQGSSNPIADNATEEGRVKNRRVEIVPLTPISKRPVIDSYSKPINEEGHISFLQKDVSSQPPWAKLFEDAQINQPIYELHKIRTLEDSRTVVTFTDLSEMKIGDNTVMIIYGSPLSVEKPGRKENMELTRGGLMAKLKSLNPNRKFVVKTPSAEVTLNTESQSKLGVDDADRSTVSVFKGQLDVSAKDTTVNVPSGFGTEVAKGAAPKPPTPLPPSPRRILPDEDSLVFSSTGNQYRWIPTTSRTRLEISNDSVFNTIAASSLVSDSSTAVSLKPGLYYYRFIGVDSAGLESNPDSYHKLIVIDSATYHAALMITEPKSLNTAVSSTSYTLAGRAEPRSTVEVNGSNVHQAGDGSFSLLCTLQEGDNTFSVSVIDRKGGRNQIPVHVQYLPEKKKFNIILGASPFVRFFNYDSFSNGSLFNLAAEYRITDAQAVGVKLIAGDIFNRHKTVNTGTHSDSLLDPEIWILHATLRDDIIRYSSFALSIDSGIGPMSWSQSDQTTRYSANRFALTFGGGVMARIDDDMFSYAIGVHYTGIVNDKDRFDPLSRQTNHSMIGVNLAIFFSH